jgi:hypothetical protein
MALEFNIDHHHNIWHDCTVVNPYFTLSKVDSVIFGQVLSDGSVRIGSDAIAIPVSA